MKRLLILGANGRLGSALVRGFKSEFKVTGLARQALDLNGDFSDQLAAYDFDAVVNAAAATNVDWCENHPSEARRINGEAVGKLGRICARRGARCIHISTDYVFDGKKRAPYLETDEPNPINIYGESKLRGEEGLLESDPKHLVIRVSWVFGPDRMSFVDSILDRAKREKTVEAVDDKFSVPTYTADFVGWLRPLLANEKAGGILHACQSGNCTWQQYGQVAIEAAKEIGIPLVADRVQPISLESLRTFAAKRPVYTVMDTGRLAELIGSKPRPWEEAVREYVQGKYSSPA